MTTILRSTKYKCGNYEFCIYLEIEKFVPMPWWKVAIRSNGDEMFVNIGKPRFSRPSIKQIVAGWGLDADNIVKLKNK